MDNYTLSMIVVSNILMFFLGHHFFKKKSVFRLKHKSLNTELQKVLTAFKMQITCELLSDGRIKLAFPVTIVENELNFYLFEDDDGMINISDAGEVISRLDMSLTVNKNAIKKACATFGVNYFSSAKALLLKSNLDQLDESIWKMFCALLVIEYASY